MKSKDPCIWDNQFATLLLDSMAEGVFTIDPYGKITSWNPSMKRITGYDADEAIGKTCSMIQFNQCYKRNCPESIRQCKIFEKGRVDSKECKLIHKNGHMVTVLKNACVVKDNNGEVVGVVETITDLTDLMDAREKTKEAAEDVLGCTPSELESARRDGTGPLCIYVDVPELVRPVRRALYPGTYLIKFVVGRTVKEAREDLRR